MISKVFGNQNDFEFDDPVKISIKTGVGSIALLQLALLQSRR